MKKKDVDLDMEKDLEENIEGNIEDNIEQNIEEDYQEDYQENYKSDKKKKHIILATIIIILLIIIIFLLIRCLGKIENGYRIPTGNIDIFDIVFGNSANCTCGCNCNNQNNVVCNCNAEGCICNGNNVLPLTEETSSNSKKQRRLLGKISTTTEQNSAPQGNAQGNGQGAVEDNNTQGSLDVYDEDDVTVENNTKLNIFKQATYHVLNDKIAPTSENTYQFVVRNNNNFNLSYDLEMFEKNTHNINMKFRLKLNGKYIIGNDKQYVDAEELSKYDLDLPAKTYDVYTLDWKWVESDNDTDIGTSIDAAYQLYMKVYAEQI